MAPDLSMIASTSSTTSKYASLLVYLTPVLRHGMLDSCPVGSFSLTLRRRKSYTKAILHIEQAYLVLPVTVLAMVLSIFGGLINSFRILLSVARG